MKRITAILLTVFLCMSLLSACAKQKAVPEGPQVCFGIDWSATPEQAAEALNLSADTLWGGALTVEDTEFFGARADAAFHFTKDSEDQLRLSHIVIIYPDDTNMAKVRKSLTKAYGPPLESCLEYSASMFSSALEERTLTTTDHFAFWHSSRTMAGCAADPEFPLRADWQFYLDAMQAQDENAKSDGKLTDYYSGAPIVRLFWTDSGCLPYLPETSQPKNTVLFDASLLASMR